MAVRKPSLKPRIMHRIPGRMRIKLPGSLTPTEKEGLVQDLQLSPDVKQVSLRGHCLIIEHNQDDVSLTRFGAMLDRIFPDFQRWSDNVDAEVAKTASDPWINKGIPLAIVGIAVYRGIVGGSILAGESAFALAYVAFDLYWKFQQENVIKKIETGLSAQQKGMFDN